ncbi:MAG TPA: DNRLRE domain-containing protein, partial [Flavisolibacter sp.]|nr:DNRLRE domain-containing protein [Flavisolibacter sp.]
INLSVYGVNADSWAENSIYFNIAPGASTSALSTVSVNNTRKYYEFDVTGYVKTQATGDKIVSFLIKNPANQNMLVNFNSKENRQNKPQLVITRSTSNVTNSTRSYVNTNTSDLKDKLEKPKIFPNPLHQKFSISFPIGYKGDITLEVVDVTGKTYDIGKYELEPGGRTIDVDITKLSLKAGIYFLRIYSVKRKDVVKVVVQ